MNMPLIRAMANTLVDHDIDPFDAVAVVKRLTASGFAAKQIHKYYDPVVKMAATRRHHERKANERKGNRKRVW
jgi:hypothetical protein